ncbi:MAG: FAD-binding oxidoreductase [Acidobacteriota bacterium]
MSGKFDAVIIGGGIIGLSIGYHLTQKGKKVVVIEKKYTGSGSTGRCIGGIRMQFSTEASIKLMQESMSHFLRMEEDFGFSVEFLAGGYLFLAHSEEKLKAFREVMKLQKKLGLNVRELTPAECEELVPGMNIEGLKGGVYSPDDSQAYPFKVLRGYINGIREGGSIVRTFTEVTGIKISGGSVSGVELENGEIIDAHVVVNAAGPWAAEVGRMAGVDLPIFPEEHEALISDRYDHLFDPMVVDYRPDGCYFQQMVTGQIIGCYSPVPNKPGKQTSSSSEFLLEMSKRTSRLIPGLKDLNVLRHWGGSYSMTPDGSPIVDKTGVDGFYVAVGMSGHGFMFGPAIGKFLAQIITDETYPYEWDEFKLDRDFSRQEIMK